MSSATSAKGYSAKIPVQQAGLAGATRRNGLQELMHEAYEEDSPITAPQVTFYWAVTLLPFFMLGLIALAVIFLLSR